MKGVNVFSKWLNNLKQRRGKTIAAQDTMQDKGNQNSGGVTFEGVVIYHNRIFDLGRAVNPIEAARELLTTDLARAFANPVTSEVEIATKYRELVALRQQAEELSQLWRTPLKLPRLIWWYIRHPRHALDLVTTKQPDQNSQDESDTDGRAVAGRTVAFLDDAMINLQLGEKIPLLSDSILFSPTYLADAPFTRVGLQPFSATLNGEQQEVDVSLLIHRTGVGILTFYIMYSNSVSAEQLISMQLSKSAKVSHIEITRTIAESQSRFHGWRTSRLSQPNSRNYSSGVEWWKYEDIQNSTLVTLFDLYQDAVRNAIA